ncbi:glycogen synthase [Chloroflexota bacterium]
MDKLINIAYVASEATPFVKVGGLADVAGSLPKALNSLNDDNFDGIKLDMRVVLPLHNCGDTNNLIMERFLSFQLTEGFGDIEITAYKTLMNDTITYFLDGSFLSDSSNVYSENPVEDQKKFIQFSFAAVRFFQLIDWKVDIFHVNDWHTALCLAIIKMPVFSDFYSFTKSVLTIHNLPYLGGNSDQILKKFGMLRANDINMPTWAQDQFLPIGIVAADEIVTVSKTYAEEIQTPNYGCGLENYLLKNRNKIRGIINGLDSDYWNPVTDKHLYRRFSIETLHLRLENKEDLLCSIGLKIERKIPLVGMVTRINHQKGIDLALNVFESILAEDWQLVILGSGDSNLENDVINFQKKYPGKVRFLCKYDESMAHKIYSGTDLFLMPSRYEPCGLSQMIANRYGSIPIVTGVGGLKDTIIHEKNGYVAPEVNEISIKKVMERAFMVFDDLDRWRLHQKNGMRMDYSWTNSAKEYVVLYRQLMARK